MNLIHPKPHSFLKFLSIDGADPRLKSNVIFSLAQIAYTEENYKEAIKLLKEWLTNEANPSSTGFDIIAASHWQLKNKKLAIKNAETGLCVAKANKSKPRESTYNLLLALYNEDGKTKKMLSLYEELVIFHPKKKYWTQLSGIYGELKQENNQLTALEAAFDQGLLDKKNEYILITSAVHMKRSILCFKNVGLKIIPFSVDNSMSFSSNKIEYILLPRSRVLENWEELIHEIIGYYVYLLTL